AWARANLTFRTILLGALLGGVLGVAVRLAIPRRYQSVIAFITEPEVDRRGGLAAVSGLASQFGIAIGAVSTQSPQFYGDLIVTPTVLDYVLAYPDSCAP